MGKARLRWGSVVEKVWKDIGGKQKEIRARTVQGEFWGVQDRIVRKDRMMGKASAKKKDERGGTLINTSK